MKNALRKLFTSKGKDETLNINVVIKLDGQSDEISNGEGVRTIEPIECSDKGDSMEIKKATEDSNSQEENLEAKEIVISVDNKEIKKTSIVVQYLKKLSIRINREKNVEIKDYKQFGGNKGNAGEHLSTEKEEQGNLEIIKSDEKSEQN